MKILIFYYWFFTYLLWMPYKHRRKCQVTTKGVFYFFILSVRNFAKFKYWTLLCCALNTIYIWTQVYQLWQICMNGSPIFLWIFMTFLPSNLEVLIFGSCSGSFHPAAPPPSPLLVLLRFLVHWVYEISDIFIIHIS